MYLSYFGFKEYPFSVTPDPAFLYLSASHREALGHLLYGAGEHGGFVALTGEVGTGKTTLIRALVHDDLPDLQIALCWNPHLGTNEFVATVCDELGVTYEPGQHATLKALVDRLNAHLLKTHAANRRTVLIVDEAQNLSRDVLEQLRLLTNLETHKEKLLRIILVGQPELTDLLARHDLRQLSQRITARFHLRPLGLAETRAYIQHRLECAQGPQHLFSGSAVMAAWLVTRGVPRLINMVCERALMGGYAHARSTIGPATVLRAAAETLPPSRRRRLAGRWRLAAPVAALAVVVTVSALVWQPAMSLSAIDRWIPYLGQAGHPALAHESPKAVHTTNDEGGDSDKSDAASPAKTDAAPDKRSNTQADKTSQPPVARSVRSAAGAGDSPSGSAKAPKSASDQAVAGQTASATTSVLSASGGESTSADAAGSKSKKPQEGIPKGNADINQLLRLWGVFGAQVRTDCASLHVGDLRCLADSGDFATLKRYNRPALLVLQRGNTTQTVLLSAIKGDTATLMGAQGTREVKQAQLLKSWTGRFQVVWRSDSRVGLIQPGAVGDAVVWLRRRLLQIDHKNPDSQVGTPSPVYDAALEKRLKTFQRAHGLAADGMAGPRTQMMLNGAVPSPGSPSLHAVSK
ncbi:MAG: AAA family ATPase [Salinisphaera sp.]|jgi:general secretion pathway protein A|nr:AAA family ATPase [Salinisphaera sp.]